MMVVIYKVRSVVFSVLSLFALSFVLPAVFDVLELFLRVDIVGGTARVYEFVYWVVYICVGYTVCYYLVKSHVHHRFWQFLIPGVLVMLCICILMVLSM